MSTMKKDVYEKTVVPALQEKFGYKNVMQIPRLQKIVINMGVGAAASNRKVLDEALDTLAAITGQKPVVTKARKAISNFKLREGLGIGAKVTLHGACVTSVVFRVVVSMAAVTIRSASRNSRSLWKSILTKSLRLSVWTFLS